jgi:hypothetical protein
LGDRPKHLSLNDLMTSNPLQKIRAAPGSLFLLDSHGLRHVESPGAGAARDNVALPDESDRRLLVRHSYEVFAEL